ncbi:MAG: hypothetical protein BroJett030_31020 [Alphaproteobacteria bacterium]|nr:MAG: hypothetical protein BroJett030_31020 [Alphaproteobacteria bacterium]
MRSKATWRLTTVLVGALVAALLAEAQARADPDPRPAENWRTDFSVHSIDLGEIRSGGPPRDGIPSIDHPQFIAVADEARLSDRDPVIALVADGEARAYPLAVLTWHEIVNDEIAGRPVAVTYCPLCNAAIVFDAMVDGQRLEFGTTGRLRNSDLIMYDRQTESWWQQFTGEAIVGQMTGKKLRMLPATIVPWNRFRMRHPQGSVLVPNDPAARAYGRNPYAGYDSASRPFLYSGDLPAGIEPMARVVIVEGASGPFVVALDHLREQGRVAKDGVVLSWQAGAASALDAAVISQGRDVGFVTVTRDGTDIVHHVTFAFVAHAFHPEVAIEGAGK